MKRYYALFAVVMVAAVLLTGGCAVVLYLHLPDLFWLPLALLLFMLAGIALIALHFRKLFTGWMTRLAKRIDPQQQTAIDAFPMPVIMTDENGCILYSNKLFNRQVMGGNPPILDTPMTQVFEGFSVSELTSNDTINLVRGERKYTGTVSMIRFDKSSRYVVYLTDDTELKDTAAEYKASRPVVLQICIDNLDEATVHLRAGDRARIGGAIETMLEDWVTAEGGFLQKYSNERFVAITEHRCLTHMVEDRFSILERVRKAFPEVEGSITLSIGIGKEKTMIDCRRSALRALDMALSRGGDQVAVKTVHGYDFFGGHSGGVQQRTRVRTRIIAESLKELIASSDRVLVMGHRMSDLDCIGGGIALAAVAERMGIPAGVVVERNATMASQLVERFNKNLFVDVESARRQLTKKSLLIVVDTHSVNMLESAELYDMAERVVVIDHHRRMVNYIEDTVLTYHEPTSSSACELIAELLPYLSDRSYGRDVAEALLSGIMLDTRNFVLRTGVRTFEAAAYLRSLGADTVSVKKMFSESLEMYRRKSDLVAAAEPYRRTAIALSQEDYANYRAAAAQAADDLLSVKGVIASFVITPMDDRVQISARSYGECNVQLIMESLSGGGHLTMAATQLKDTTLDDAYERLKVAIDVYFDTKQM